ncbi:tryptophan-rich sensory protein [Candidatus Gracilibacteria bacterium]|nr:tryptophan-rich sensory protein [Candidatus Gracilibacteria bacterium]
MKPIRLVQLAFCVVVVELAGIVGSLFTIPSIPTWYATLQKPLLSPPSWVFGPVWTALYFLMGVSLFLVLRKGVKERRVKEAALIFCIQLGLNVLWSLLFFGLHSPILALIDIIALWFSIGWTIVVFYKLSRPAGLLLIPYLAWVSFASYLNYAIWIINGDSALFG